MYLKSNLQCTATDMNFNHTPLHLIFRHYRDILHICIIYIYKMKVSQERHELTQGGQSGYIYMIVE